MVRWAALTCLFLGVLGCATPPEAPDDAFWSDLLRDYSRMYPYKALAIGDDSSGFSFGAPSPEAAILRAIATCDENSATDPSGCQLWALGARVVDGLDPHLLLRELDLYRVRVIGEFDVEVDPDSTEIHVPWVSDYID